MDGEKTTLVRLLGGLLETDRGEIECAVETRMFPHPHIDDRLTQPLSGYDVAKDAAGEFRVWEQRMEECLSRADEPALVEYTELESSFSEQGGYEIDSRLESELLALDIGSSAWVRPFAELSGGEQTRCQLAGLFALERGYPLIDEPTNHLDKNGRSMLASYLNAKSGFLLVSHDRSFLDACTDHIIALNPDTVETPPIVILNLA